MRKNKLGIIALIGLMTMSVACGISCSNNSDDKHTHNHKKIENGSTFTLTCDCGDVFKGYRIQFVYAEDGSQADAGIEVNWTDKAGNNFTAKTNALGYVETIKPTEDSYTLSINQNTLPVIDGLQYSYDSNEFNEQSNGTGLTIPLFATHKPLNIDDPNINGRPVNIITGKVEKTENRYRIELNKTYVATLNSANDQVWYDIIHSGFGNYTVDASTSKKLDVTIEKYNASVAYIPTEPDPNVDLSEKNKLTYVVKYGYRDSESTFCIKAPNAKSYPVNVPFSVAITFEPENNHVAEMTHVKPTHFETQPSIYTYYTSQRGSNEKEPHTIASLAPVQGVQKWENIEGSVIKNLTEEQYNTIELRSDGYYYTKANQLVFAKLNAPSIFEASTLASYLYDSAYINIYQVAEYDEYGCRIRWENYFGFIQAYTAISNNDGLYPLTKEMHDFLSKLAAAEHQGTNLLLCTYPTQINNFVQGDGSNSNPFVITLNEQTLGNYRISISDGGKTYLTLNGTMDVALTFNSNVKATINGANYQDSLSVDGSATIVFETINGQAQDFVLKIAKYKDPSVIELGTNQTFAIPGAQVLPEFICPEEGKYDITVSSVLATVTVKTSLSDEGTVISGTHTVTLTKGQILYFIIETDAEEQFDFTIIVEKNILED